MNAPDIAARRRNIIVIVVFSALSGLASFGAVFYFFGPPGSQEKVLTVVDYISNPHKIYWAPIHDFRLRYTEGKAAEKKSGDPAARAAQPAPPPASWTKGSAFPAAPAPSP